MYRPHDVIKNLLDFMSSLSSKERLLFYATIYFIPTNFKFPAFNLENVQFIPVKSRGKFPTLKNFCRHKMSDG